MTCLDCFVPKPIRELRATTITLYTRIHNDVIQLFMNNTDMMNYSIFNRYWNDYMRFEYEFPPKYIELYGSRHPPQNYITYSAHANLATLYQRAAPFKLTWYQRNIKYRFSTLTFESIFEKAQRETNQYILTSQPYSITGYNLDK